MAQEYVLSMDDRRATLEAVGGKGASLARLLRAGVPVPGGFYLTTAAYERFVTANDLESGIRNALQEAEPSKPDTLESASGKIEELFLQGRMPEEISEAISRAYASLDETAVAVRSSATAEDLPEASFAGQQETFLNVRGEKELEEAVKRCWASLWTARAIAYRERQYIDSEAVSLAVVVQRMAPAEAAGILFTADPVGGRRDRSVVNAAWGLGEAVVGGQVTPDTLVVDKASGRVLSRETADKEVMTVYTEHGTGERPVPEARRRRPVLDDEAAAELVRYGVRIEELYGSPQDIEWVLGDGGLAILQARPITNLPPAPLRDVRWEPPTPDSAWVRRQVVEHMPEPLSPLFDELYLREGLELSVDEVLDEMQATMGMPRSIAELMERPLFTTVNGYAYQRANFKMKWNTVPILISYMRKAIPGLFRQGISYWRDRSLPAYLATIEHWKAIDPATASDEELLRGIRELAYADAIYWFASALAIGAAKLSDGLLDRFLAIAAAGRDLTSGAFLRGFPSKSLEAEMELEDIARQIRRKDVLRSLVTATPAPQLLEALANNPDGRPLLDDIRGYFDRYGHQIYSLDFAVPTQADDPLPVLLSLKALVQHSGRDARVRQAEVLRARRLLTERTARSFGPLRRPLFRRLLRLAQRFGPYREEALFYVGAAWPTLRRLALELGRRLVETGTIDARDDVFYLQTPELDEAIAARAAGQAKPDLARLARERRALREPRKRLQPPAAVPLTYTMKVGGVDLSSFESQQRNTGDGSTLRGFAVSPGDAQAPASVILSSADFDKMEPGTILVCPTTTPAWTPLFAQARGLVTDIGGVLAHGSIVAREYDIPAVMGTGVATRRIRSGQRVRVNGDAGTVTLLDGVDGAEQPAREAVFETRAPPDLRAAALLALAAGTLIGAVVWWKSRRRS